MIINRLKPVVVVLAGALGALALAAFGSDSADPATAVPAAATTVPPAATAVPTTAPTETVALPTTMPVPPTVAATNAPDPTSVPTVAPTATSALDTVYSEYGFTLNLDLGADVQSAGYSESALSETQGLASFLYSVVIVGLVWSLSNSKAPLEFVAASYNDIQTAQPGINFDSISGANTAFDELANLADLGAVLEQDGNSIINDGVFDLFGGNLFSDSLLLNLYSNAVECLAMIF